MLPIEMLEAPAIEALETAAIAAAKANGITSLTWLCLSGNVTCQTKQYGGVIMSPDSALGSAIATQMRAVMMAGKMSLFKF